MKKKFFVLIAVLFTFLAFNVISLQKLQAQNTKQTFTHRTNTSVERVIIELDAEMNATTIAYQGKIDKVPVKLTILKKDKEEGKITAQRPDNKAKMVFSMSWIMGGAMFLANGEIKEFGNEISCTLPTGEILLTSGGPMFLPFYYAPNTKSSFTLIDVPQEQIGNSKILPSGEFYYEVTIPNKAGKYKIAPMSYDDDGITKIKLIDPKGKTVIFKSKK